MDVTLEKFINWVPKGQNGIKDIPPISQAKGQRINAAAGQLRDRLQTIFIFFRLWVTPQPVFCLREEKNHMLEAFQSLEAQLYPIVCSINVTLSSYILVFLLIGVGL